MTVRGRTAAIAALTIVIVAIPLLQAFDAPGFHMDEGFLLVYPELILKGHLPYRDFETFYGPGGPYALSAVYAIFGVNIVVERAIGLIYRLLIVGAVFGLARRWGIGVGVGCSLIAGLLLVDTGVVAFAWIGAMAFGLLSLWLSAELEKKWRCAVGGFFAGVALLYRLDIAPAVIAAAIPLLLHMNGGARWHWLGGAAAGILPLGVITLLAGVGPVFENLFLLPVLYSSPGRRLPLSSADSYVVCLFFTHVIASIVNVGTAIITVRRSGSETNARVFLAWALFGLFLTHQAWQRLDFLHVLYPAFVSIALLPVSLLMVSKPTESDRVGMGRATLATLTVFALVTLAAPRLLMRFHEAVVTIFVSPAAPTVFLEHNNRSFPFRSQESARETGRVLEQLQRLSKPGERLFVGPADLRRTNLTDTFIYHLMPQLRPATYFLEMNPFSANRTGSRLPADLESADWLVLNRRWDNWKEPNRSGELGPDAPNEVVRQRFRLLGEYGSYLLFQKKQGEGAGD
ncbi:MAG TPA: hypothetical protein VM940_08095 [Chthoniobacterales bacterium]|nr:hypothetical protein [Chthoniobacterales bacterium]